MARLLNMRPDDQVEPHLAAHLEQKRRLNHTPMSRRERRLTLLRIARSLGHPVADSTHDELRAWQTQRSRELTPAAMHNEIVHLSVYMKWLITEEIRSDNPALRLDRPKHDRKGHPHPMSDRDITRALAAALDLELHVWIGLGAFCGLRCMEIAKLAREDIAASGPDSYLRIMGKGNKERIVPLPGPLLEELTSGPFNPTGHLFSRLDGKPGPPSAVRVSERINDHLHALGIRHTAHSLRHRFGTEAYRRFHDPFRVAGWMGHSSTDTTRGYVALVDEAGAKLAATIMDLAS